MRAMMTAAGIGLCLLAFHCEAAALAQADRSAIDGVITAQLEAFRHDDGEAALRLATPGLQRQFGDGAHFLDVVRQDYPAVFRPRVFRFGELAAADGVVVQKVELIGPDGTPATALYEMRQQPDGSWRISGCSLATTKQLQI